MKMSALTDFIRYHVLLLKGRIRIHKEEHGKDMFTDKNLAYRIFLCTTNTQYKKAAGAGVNLTIQFKVKRMSFMQKFILPYASIPFFAGQQGFVSKKFMLCESCNAFQGYYEWDTMEHAERYVSSYAMWFMRRISLQGSINFNIKPCIRDINNEETVL